MIRIMHEECVWLFWYVQSGTSSVGNLILQHFMYGFGEQTVAAITTAYRVDSVIILPIINFGSGIDAVVAPNSRCLCFYRRIREYGDWLCRGIFLNRFTHHLPSPFIGERKPPVGPEWLIK